MLNHQKNRHTQHLALNPNAVSYSLFPWVTRYWFFANLQHLTDTALLGIALDSGARPGVPLPSTASNSSPMPISLKVKPFPWPAATEDVGAAAAAIFFQVGEFP